MARRFQKGGLDLIIILSYKHNGASRRLKIWGLTYMSHGVTIGSEVITMTEKQEKQRWSVNELADAAGVTDSYIRRLLNEDGGLHGIKHGTKHGGFWEIEGSEARRWLSARGVDV